ncbi:DinB family protein [Galbibacter mesophilus]|uniref:DinB family protein n=1 Tax=Galbibacter mesophilus TaxID=379069 RepID=UPI00191F2C0E|nr:DinB family protein [Galbibacter mesophilus]MCM5662611.1 DinB family protein [Galbibacter mesophilus]
MNDSYLNYVEYTIWANNRLMNDLESQQETVFNHTFVGSFPTIRATLLHLWYAETGWLSRMERGEWLVGNVTNFSGDIKTLFKEWKATTKAFKVFVETANLEKELEFEHKGEHFSIPFREIVQTVCNHGSYHRGQIVLMMRQLGITNISQTDYIEWVREKERGNI